MRKSRREALRLAVRVLHKGGDDLIDAHHALGGGALYVKRQLQLRAALREQLHARFKGFMFELFQLRCASRGEGKSWKGTCHGHGGEALEDTTTARQRLGHGAETSQAPESSSFIAAFSDPPAR